MTRFSSVMLQILVLASGITAANAIDVRNRSSQDIPIVDGSPILAPFQHVRFCLRYPGDCQSDPTQNELIELNDETSGVLERVNQHVNAAIIPTAKGYGSNLEDGWTISPSMGDCNDYAVTKRHELYRAVYRQRLCGSLWLKRPRESVISFSS